MPSINTISVDKLARLIGTPKCPLLIDVRTDEDFAADPRLVPARSGARIERRANGRRSLKARPPSWSARGQKLSQAPPPGCAMTGRRRRRSKAASRPGSRPACRWCRPSKLPARDAEGRTVWVTRARPEGRPHRLPLADPALRRSAAPYSCSSRPPEVAAVGERFGAAPFDIEGVFWSHRGELCTFDIMVEEFGLAHRAAAAAGADRARRRHGAARSRAGGAPACWPPRSACRACIADDLAAARGRDGSLRRVLSLVPRRDRRDPQLAAPKQDRESRA